MAHSYAVLSCLCNKFSYGKVWNSKSVNQQEKYGWAASSSVCSRLTLSNASALQAAGSQTEAPVGFSHLLLVSGLDQTKHDCCKCHAPPCPPPQAAICPSVGALAALGPDEIGANFPLTLAHLRWHQRPHSEVILSQSILLKPSSQIWFQQFNIQIPCTIHPPTPFFSPLDVPLMLLSSCWW